jgi:hypothetical protein
MGNFIPSGFTNAHSSSNSISFNFEQDKPVLNQEKILFELYDGFDKETGLSISLFRYPSNKLTSNHLKSLAFNAVCVGNLLFHFQIICSTFQTIIQF